MGSPARSHLCPERLPLGWIRLPCCTRSGDDFGSCDSSGIWIEGQPSGRWRPSRPQVLQLTEHQTIRMILWRLSSERPRASPGNLMAPPPAVALPSATSTIGVHFEEFARCPPQRRKHPGGGVRPAWPNHIRPAADDNAPVDIAGTRQRITRNQQELCREPT